jgi:hypothetical protein
MKALPIAAWQWGGFHRQALSAQSCLWSVFSCWLARLTKTEPCFDLRESMPALTQLAGVIR